MGQLDDPLQWTAVAALAVSLVLIGGGWFYRSRRSHLAIMAGEALFVLYWVLMVPHFIEVGDAVNAVFCALSAPFFAWAIYHHWLCYKWDEDVDSLQWIAGATFITSAIYFSVLYVDVLAKGLITLTAALTVGVLQAGGYDAALGAWTQDVFGGHALVVVGDSSGDTWINIVLACTGLQAIALFLGAIIALKPDRGLWAKWAEEVVHGKLDDGGGESGGGGKAGKVKKGPRPAKGKGDEVPPAQEGFLQRMRKRRLARLLRMSDRARFYRAIIYTAPVIFVMNLARNVAIVGLSYEDVLDFHIAHNYIAKGLAFVLLIILTLACFSVLPELQENILGIMDLRHRKRKGDIENGFVKLEVLEAAVKGR